MEHWWKWPFSWFWKDGLLAELHGKTSREWKFLLFKHNSYEVTLKQVYEHWYHGVFIHCEKLILVIPLIDDYVPFDCILTTIKPDITYIINSLFMLFSLISNIVLLLSICFQISALTISKLRVSAMDFAYPFFSDYFGVMYKKPDLTTNVRLSSYILSYMSYRISVFGWKVFKVTIWARTALPYFNDIQIHKFNINITNIHTTIGYFSNLWEMF